VLFCAGLTRQIIIQALQLWRMMKSLRSFFFPENVVGYERSLEKLDKTLRSTKVGDGCHNIQHNKTFEALLAASCLKYCFHCFRAICDGMRQLENG
jgi:hypothetical protein